MLNAVTAINHHGDSISMNLRNPEKSGFLISNITGIGPPSSDINVTDLAVIDGGYFNSARAIKRNIVMTIIFVDDEQNAITSMETIRQKTYKYFPVKKPITLLFETDNRTCGIDGYVESNSPEIFSNQESTQISVICPYPYFYDAYGDGETKIAFSSSYGAFEFPFSNEITSEEYADKQEDAAGYHTNWKHIEFGIVTIDYQKDIAYSGEADTGIVIEIMCSGRVENPAVYNAVTGETIKVNRTFASGDTIIISTIRGQKYARLLRNGDYINILNNVDKNASWLILENGSNVISFTADSGIDSMSLTITYRTLYEGV